jgi:hypothetical protein
LAARGSPPLPSPSTSTERRSSPWAPLTSWVSGLTGESRFRAGCFARLAQHLPRGQLLRQLGSGLLLGKVAHCLPVVAWLRLPGSTAAIPESLAQVQVSVNNVARSIIGCRREDHFTIVDLLEAAKYLSLNQQAVKATAMSAWTAFPSCDGTSGAREPDGDAMFSGAELPTAPALRSTRQGWSGSGREGWIPT